MLSLFLSIFQMLALVFMFLSLFFYFINLRKFKKYLDESKDFNWANRKGKFGFSSVFLADFYWLEYYAMHGEFSDKVTRDLSNGVRRFKRIGLISFVVNIILFFVTAIFVSQEIL